MQRVIWKWQRPGLEFTGKVERTWHWTQKQADAVSGASSHLPAWNKDVMPGAETTILPGPWAHKQYFK